MKSAKEGGYCDSILVYRRAETVPVPVGGVVIGGGKPVVVQSMCSVDTNDIAAAEAQVRAIVSAGGELVRLTTQGSREAESIGQLSRTLRAGGCRVPLAADVHFNPAVALLAAEKVEKVRINPGNFIDKRADFRTVNYTDAEYALELERLRREFVRLIGVCRAHGTTLRIGVNHGSLSDRIMSRYGNTPEGMCESAMEFLRIASQEKFGRVVVSMKSSRTPVMVHAYRLLAARMRAEGLSCPFHLGVTEAGEGDEGIVRSAVGIGALLNDGLGDTIRVSLTAPPEEEIPVARELLAYYAGRSAAVRSEVPEAQLMRYCDPFGSAPASAPFIVAEGRPDEPGDFEAGSLPVVRVDAGNIYTLRNEAVQGGYLQVCGSSPQEQRWLCLMLRHRGIEGKVILYRSYAETERQSLQIKAGADLGMLLLDGFGDGIWIDNPGLDTRRTAKMILQAAARRITGNEYISCPGCGRTMFDLVEVARRVKRATSHLRGLKIAVMGCIVNGPGEMAGADYGYVGAARGRVTLYKGLQPVRKNIPQEEALDQLIALIRENGDWKEPEKEERR